MAEFAGGLRERAALAPAGGAARWWACGVRPATTGSGATTDGEAIVGRPRWRLLFRAEAGPSLSDGVVWRGRVLRPLRVEWDPALPDRVSLLAEETGEAA